MAMEIVADHDFKLRDDLKEADPPLDSSPLSGTSFDVRIGVIGNVDSGKSTLIGVLTCGEYDDGRGSARKKVFRHAHELENGRTSCISHHILGFDEKKEAVHQTISASAAPAAKSKAWQTIVSKSKSMVTFIDLAGHEKYLKTTIAGLTGCYPHYASVLVGANMGVSKMTKEHIGVAIALEIPLFVVVTKVDIAPENVLKHTLKQLYKILRHPQAAKMPMLIRKSEDVLSCFSTENEGALQPRICPVFLISSVKGTNMDLLLDFLSRLKPTPPPTSIDAEIAGNEKTGTGSVELQVDETFAVTGVGTVLSGVVRHGTLLVNEQLLLGPFTDSSFRPVVVRSIHVKRTPIDSVGSGLGCAVAIRPLDKRSTFTRSQIRPGMVLIHPDLHPDPVMAFDADVLVLHHPTTIKTNYQSMVHCGSVRQAARMEMAEDLALRTGDRASIRFSFLYHSEFIHVGSTVIFREGSTKGIGKVTKVYFGKVTRLV